MIQFLEERKERFEDVMNKVDWHFSEEEGQELQRLAKVIQPDIPDFQLHGCQECKNALAKFVWINADKLEPKAAKAVKGKEEV